MIKFILKALVVGVVLWYTIPRLAGLINLDARIKDVDGLKKSFLNNTFFLTDPA